MHRCAYCGVFLLYTGEHEEGCPLDPTSLNEEMDNEQQEFDLEYDNGEEVSDEEYQRNLELHYANS